MGRISCAGGEPGAISGIRTKRIAILAMSMGFHVLSSLWEAIRRAATNRARATCVVLYYHQVRKKDSTRFARQMDILLRHAHPLRVDTTERLTPGLHYVGVTFDDGFENVIENALPELRKRQIPSTLFIVTEALGTYPNWLTGAYESAERARVVSPEGLRNVAKDLVSVGSHTMTHPALPNIEEADAKREISQSKTKLEQMLDSESKVFSFPYGAFSATLIESCRQAGYRRIFTSLPTYALSDPFEFVSGRVSVEPTDWAIEFRLKLLGAYRWLPIAYRVKRWLRSLLAPTALRTAAGREGCSSNSLLEQ